ncbi:MAG: UDP-N-acetylglucosamine 1-carboxyvinyltransferase [Firmicutes bacterium]|nr:UDP-N-acetylglucosamine 1-carboxyvinyltransferase [Bacillota bacterium]
MNTKDEVLMISKKNPLNGKINIPAAKNACLPIICASVLLDGKTVLRDVPKIVDIKELLAILKDIGANITHRKNGTLTIDSSGIKSGHVLNDSARKIRSSIFLLSPLLSRFGEVSLPLPGGCSIGKRPIDFHVEILKKMGAVVEVSDRKIIGSKDVASALSLPLADATSCDPNIIELPFASVGATINAITLAAKSLGKTTIKNCAKEPEIEDVADFLNKAGAKILGAGTDTIMVNGVDKLNGITYSPIKDRIVAGTYLIAGAMADGSVQTVGVPKTHLEPLLTLLEDLGCEVKPHNNIITIERTKPLTAKNISISTAPFPGFPTDLQAQTVALLSISSGTSTISENLFEARFKYVPELRKMGAKIELQENKAIITGVKKLTPTSVVAEDLRGGASLVLAALTTSGITIIRDIHHIDRGYYKIEEELNKLGTSIKRVKV